MRTTLKGLVNRCKFKCYW